MNLFLHQFFPIIGSRLKILIIKLEWLDFFRVFKSGKSIIHFEFHFYIDFRVHNLGPFSFCLNLLVFWNRGSIYPLLFIFILMGYFILNDLLKFLIGHWLFRDSLFWFGRFLKNSQTGLNFDFFALNNWRRADNVL